MTREELYQSIYSSDIIYLPNREDGTAALEVACGCSWGKCEFCDFAKDEFKIIPLEKVEYNVRVLGQLRPGESRVFFLGENGFTLSSGHLCGIIDLVNRHMPSVREISMYARIDDIMRKSDEELRLLRQRGVSRLHIGVESGSDLILRDQKKGFTAADTVRELQRLDDAGIEYYATVILGLGGREHWRSHAVETAAMLNQVHPKNIWCLKLKLWENTPLYEKAQRGAFNMLTDLEIVDEEVLMVENLQVGDCIFEDTTVLNSYTVQGTLPGDKEVIVKALKYLKALEMQNIKYEK